MIIVRNWLTGLLPGRFPTMCIWPFIFISNSVNENNIDEIIRHERIHGRQQIEMAWILFFVWYILEFLIRFLFLRSFMKAYQNLAHEKEAYLNDHDPSYLIHRKPYSWLIYLF